MNLTDRARQGLLDPLIGRTDELQRTIEVLCRRRKNNPVFVGDAGVGKTAMAEGLATRLLAGRRARPAEGRRGLLARLRRAAGRHPVPRRLRGALQGRHPRAGRAAARDSLHRRNPLHRRRRRDHRRHDGSRHADQADPHRRRPARHRLDDVRGLQAHREGPRAGAAAAEDRDRRAVDRGDGEDPRRPARPLRGAPRRDLHGRGARSRRQAGRAPPARLPAARQRDRRHRRSRRGRAPRNRGQNRDRSRSSTPSDIEAIVARMARIPARQASSSDRERLRTLEESLRARGVRPARGRASRGAGDQAIARGPRHAGAAGRRVPVHRSDRRRQDGAGQTAGDCSSATSSSAST